MKRPEILVNVAGNKPRVVFDHRDSSLLIICSKCFAEFCRRIALAYKGKCAMPLLGEAQSMCVVDAGTSGKVPVAFPADAYVYVQKWIADNSAEIPGDIHCRIDGVKPAPPEFVSVADVDNLVQKAVRQALAEIEAAKMGLPPAVHDPLPVIPMEADGTVKVGNIAPDEPKGWPIYPNSTDPPAMIDIAGMEREAIETATDPKPAPAPKVVARKRKPRKRKATKK